MSAYISGIGAWYPKQVRRNSDWPVEFAESGKAAGDRTFNDIPESLDEAARVTTRYLREEECDPFLGVLERRVADERTSAVDAEVFAARRALGDAELAASDIDVVLSYSVVPDRITPASGPAVAQRLAIPHALAWGMDAACATALVQIATASALIGSGQADHVLVTQSHLLLRAFPLLHPAAPGLGDAATAAVVSRRGKWRILESYGESHGQYYPAVTWRRGNDDTEDVPWWRSGGDFRVGTRDREAAKALQRDTVTYGVETMRELARKANVDVKRLDLLASVEPRGWMPSAVAQLLGLDPSIVCSVYKTRGHLGACGPIANLEAGYRAGKTRGRSLAGLYAQGAGFTRVGLLLQLNQS